MRLRSHITVFLFGVAVTVLLLVALMAAGVIPVKTTHTTTVVERAAATTTSTTTTPTPSAASVTGGLSASEIYQRYAQGVVEIIATFSGGADQQFFGPGGSQTQTALGSGFVVSNDGYILTNAHVVSESGETVKTVQVVFKGTGTQTKTVTGTVVGADNTSDVALIKVDPAKSGTLDPIPLGDSSTVEPGEPVVAIGNPLGYSFSITEGIVSAVNRNLQSPNGSTISNGIQTDAAINEGNSGGPLIDSAGKVIGINEQIATTTGSNTGLGFAVPIDTAETVMDQLRTSGSVSYAWLGIEGQTLSADVAKTLGLKTSEGVLVARVVSGSPADKAGIRGGSEQQVLQGQAFVTGGDVITTIDGTKVTSMEQLAGVINTHKADDTVKLTIVRDSSTQTLTVTLAERPASF
jgi:S1-C subfamily serine protease